MPRGCREGPDDSGQPLARMLQASEASTIDRVQIFESTSRFDACQRRSAGIQQVDGTDP